MKLFSIVYFTHRQEIVPLFFVRVRLVFHIRQKLNPYSYIYLNRYNRQRNCIKLLIYIDLHITSITFHFSFSVPLE